MLFRVKICGVTTPADAAMVAAAGADAIGLNFVPGSPRCLSPATARAIAAAVPPGVLKVGVFAGKAAADIRRIAGSVGLDAVQLHGHLSGDSSGVDLPERCAALTGLCVIRAVRMDAGPPPADPLARARRWIASARALRAAPALAIIEAPVARETAAGQLGGTGHAVDWPLLATTPPLDVPWALAGGLTADNVAAAIQASGAAAVDAASGVESGPGRKDAEKVRAFVSRARAAFSATGKPA